MRMQVFLIAALGMPAAGPAQAGPAPDTGPAVVIHIAQATDIMSEGVVRKIDRDARKVTIKHGPLKNLDMPPMTMVFRVTDPAMIDKVKTGDKIRFRAEKIGGAYTVTVMENAR